MKVIASNRRAMYDYAISEKIVAGMVLNSSEVKSIRNGHVSLKGAFCHINNGELWLRGAHISTYKSAQKNHDEHADRKLLVTKKQLENLAQARQNGLQIVALKIGKVGNFLKLEIGIGRAKKQYDKRHALQKKDDEKRQQQAKKQNLQK